MQPETPLIKELDELFHRDPDIDELGIIFSVPPQSSSTGDVKPDTADQQEGTLTEPQFIARGHKLGVSVHAIHPLINEARAAFPAAREAYLREKTACERQGNAVDLATRAAAAAERLLSVTRALLLVNADHGSAWNARKELARDGVYSDVRQEIKLLDLVFTKHAKSPNAWAHRRWCWRNDERFGKRQQRAGAWRPLDVEEELKVCQRVADLYPKNYYAWTQRSWVVLRIVGRAAGASKDSENHAAETLLAKNLLQRELEFVDRWLKSHVSDHSALNHRKNVVSAFAAFSYPLVASNLDFVEKERSSNSTLIRDYPGHESLWCYRRFICQTFLAVAPSQGLVDCSGHLAERSGASCSESSRDCLHEAEVGSGNDGSASHHETEVETASNERYDWSRWRHAGVEWYNGCLRAEAAAREGSSSESSFEEQDDHHAAASDDQPDYELADGDLGGAPPNGGMLAKFLGREIRFAFKCATDEGAWQFQPQRKHSLIHLAFVSYAADRILRRERIESEQIYDRLGARMIPGTQHRELEDVTEGCTAYCEITGAPKIAFPLFCTTADSCGELRVEEDDERGGNDVVRCLRALRELNGFVCGLARGDVLETQRSSNGGTVAIPYELQPVLSSVPR